MICDNCPHRLKCALRRNKLTLYVDEEGKLHCEALLPYYRQRPIYLTYGTPENPCVWCGRQEKGYYVNSFGPTICMRCISNLYHALNKKEVKIDQADI